MSRKNLISFEIEGIPVSCENARITVYPSAFGEKCQASLKITKATYLLLKQYKVISDPIYSPFAVKLIINNFSQMFYNVDYEVVDSI